MKQFFFYILSVALFLPYRVSAGIGQSDDLLRDVGQGAGAGDIEVQQAIGAGLRIALSVIGLIFLIFMVYAGFLWLTARGDDGQVEKARKTIATSIIGLLIVITSYAITVFVASIFG
jgi:amino acid transporter